MLFGIFIVALGFYLLITGSIPIGRFPGFFGNILNFRSRGSIFARLAGLSILTAYFEPLGSIGIPYLRIVLFIVSLLLILMAMISELSGSVR